MSRECLKPCPHPFHLSSFPASLVSFLIVSLFCNSGEMQEIVIKNLLYTRCSFEYFVFLDFQDRVSNT